MEQAYQVCGEIARRHYENFPVASWLLPSQLRTPITAIYAFARTADDIADEGELDDASRRHQLDTYRGHLEACLTHGNCDDPVLQAVADTVKRFRLSGQYLFDLLDAFSQDTWKKRYASFDEVLDYCRRSANPVGRLLLQLVDRDSEEARRYSDAVCTALQLINFYQDIEQDLVENDRIYLAMDEMTAACCSEQDIAMHSNNEKLTSFIHNQVRRAERMLLSGYPLVNIIGGRLGFELRFTILAAHRVACKLLNSSDIYHRPRLNLFDWPVITLRALLNSAPAIEAGRSIR